MRPQRKIEFIAKTVTDLGKAVLVVGLASAFFEKFPMAWRVAISLISIVFIFVGVFLYPEDGDLE